MLLVFSTAVLQAEFPDPHDINLIREGIGLTYNEQYDSAHTLFKTFQSKYPDIPAAQYFRAATLLAEMKDHENFMHDDSFYQYLEDVIDMADRMRERDYDSDWAYFFMGGANAYWAYQDVRKGNKLSVIQKGIRCKNLLEKCLDKNPQNHDARFGLGNSQYWGSVKTEKFNWLPLLGDDTELGIENIRIATERSLFSQELAKNALIYIYTNEEMYDSAVVIAQKFRAQYPQGKSFLWAISAACFEAEKYKKALPYFDSLQVMLDSESYQSNYNQFQLAYYRMVCHYELGNYDECLVEVDKCRNIELSGKERERLDKEYKQVEKYRRKVLEYFLKN